MENISIYNYLNYRFFLRDLFELKKKQNPSFSYRMFARKAGLRSFNFLKLVMDGLRNLSKETILKFAKGFSMAKEELEFFENMVFMNQSRTDEEKNYYYNKLSKTHGYLKSKKIEKGLYDYYSKWYNPAIREIITFENGEIGAEQISKFLIPYVSVSDVDKSVKLLLKLGLISKNDQGKYIQEHPHISTNPEVKSIMIRNYHSEMIKIASQAMANFPATLRDISCVTISINDQNIQHYKEMLYQFREMLLSQGVEKGKEPNLVMQINFQMFPLTKKMEN